MSKESSTRPKTGYLKPLSTILCLALSLSFISMVSAQIRVPLRKVKGERVGDAAKKWSHKFRQDPMKMHIVNPINSTSEDATASGKVLHKETLNYFDNLYIGDVYIGVNNSRYLFVFDTGSDYPWLPHKQSGLLTDPNANPDQVYQRKGFTCHESPSCKVDQKNPIFSGFQYGSGRVEGVIIEDTLSLGSGFSVPNSQMLLALKGDEGIKNLDADGILGLGYYPYFPEKAYLDAGVAKIAFERDFLEELRRLDKIPKVIFGINIESNEIVAKRVNGITFGDYDHDIVKDDGSIVWTPVVNPYRWNVQIDGLSVNNEFIPFDFEGRQNTYISIA